MKSVLDDKLAKQFAVDLEALQLVLDPQSQERILSYIQLVLKWNRAYNLTALESPQEILTTLVLASLALAPYVHGTKVLDVGTGSGIPGIPLACALPQTRFVLLDSNGKKTRFLKQVVYELALNNVEIVQDRVENLQSSALFDVIISRAFSSLEHMITLSKHLLCKTGCFLALKTHPVPTEIAAIPEQFHLEKEYEINVPRWQSQYLYCIRYRH